VLNTDPHREDFRMSEAPGAPSQGVVGAVIAGVLVSLSIWIALIALAPYLRSIGSPWNSLVYAVFAPTCHQIDTRCLHIFGFPMAVCARCLGIYLGFLCGTCLFPWLGPVPSRLPGPRTFVIFTLPIALDTAGNMLALWQTPSPLRLALGIFWGLILPYYLVPGLADLLGRRTRIFCLK
jgi:uncharacterized membrane protein